MFKITVTQRETNVKLAEFSADTQDACFAWAEKNWFGPDLYNWSVNFTGHEAGGFAL